MERPRQSWIYNPATFIRQPYTPPKTFNDLPNEIKDLIWEKTLEPRIVHIKYTRRPKPYLFYRVRSDQEAVVDYEGGEGYANWAEEPTLDTLERIHRALRVIEELTPTRFGFKSSCPAPAILYVCRASRNIATQLRRYEKLFGTVWFDFNQDTLFLDFGTKKNAYTEDDLSMVDLKRIRFLASYSCHCHKSLQLVRLAARMPDLKRLYLCSPNPNPLQPTDYSDLVLTSQCPGFSCSYLSSLGKHFHACSQGVLHILNCSCIDWTTLYTGNWSRTHNVLGFSLQQPGLQILWRHVQSQATKATMIENANGIGLDVLL